MTPSSQFIPVSIHPWVPGSLGPWVGPSLSRIGRQDIHVKERVAIHDFHFSVDERQVDARTICLPRQISIPSSVRSYTLW